ncbi:MAG: hypothetical protein ACYCZO_10730 [Daejeonella sp.]
MKSRMDKKANELTDFSKLSNEELAEAFIFPSKGPATAKKKMEEEEFWQERRKQFANRTPQQQIYDKLLQLKFQFSPVKTTAGAGSYFICPIISKI